MTDLQIAAAVSTGAVAGLYLLFSMARWPDPKEVPDAHRPLLAMAFGVLVGLTPVTLASLAS